MEKVIVVNVKNQSFIDYLKEHLKKIGFKCKGEILVKPNVCAPRYIPGGVTSPHLIHCLVKVLRERAEKVIVAESDGYNYSCSYAFQKTGIEKAVKKAGGETVNLSKDKLISVDFRNFRIKKILIPKTLMEADTVLNLPVMKTHEFTLYSGALKNLFGLIPYRTRIFLHPYLNDILLNLFIYVRPELTVMDALTAMEGNGPTRGNPVKLNLLLFGTCSLATDITATKIMRIDWRKISHISYIAEKTGFREESIQLNGDGKNLKCQFALPNMDLPVKLQREIYKSPTLTKIIFSNRKLVSKLQKIVAFYRLLKGSLAVSE